LGPGDRRHVIVEGIAIGMCRGQHRQAFHRHDMRLHLCHIVTYSDYHGLKEI
jgi:hypothetical protein